MEAIMNVSSSFVFGSQFQTFDAALVVCLFWIAIVKPERIYRAAMFKWACWAFAAAFLTPNLISAFFLMSNTAAPGNAIPMMNEPNAAIFSVIVGPALHMLSFLLAISSIFPGFSSHGFDVLPSDPEHRS
jgi:hypothetical protein